MSQDYSPSLVTKNLVFCGDAAMKSAAGPATLLYDKVNNNNGTMYNGTCLDFDGSDDGIDCGSITPDTGDFTIEIIYQLTGSSGRGGVFERQGASPYNGFTLGQGGPGQWAFGVSGTSSSGNQVSASWTYPTLSTWYHDVGVYSGGDTVTIYRNGALAGSNSGVSQGNLSTEGARGNFLIANRDNAAYLPCKVALVRVYNKALSAANVKELYDDSKVIIPTKNDASGGFVSQTNLIAWWPLVEGVGTIAYDGSGNGNDGTLTNMASDDWLTGQTGCPQLVEGYNRPMLFPGATTEYVAVGNSSEFCFGTSSFSFGAWIKSSYTGNYQNIFDASNFVSSPNKGWQLDTKTTTGMRLILTTGSSDSSLDTSTQVTDGQWHHVGFTWYGGSPNLATIYIDGSADTSSGAMGSIDQDGGAYAASIGFQVEGTNYPFNGLINEVVLYDALLSSSEMAALAATGPNGGPLPPDPMSGASNLSAASNVKGYWRNDGDVTWTDWSGEGNNGTVAGSPDVLLFKQGYNGQKNVNTGRDNQGFPLLFEDVGAIGFTSPTSPWMSSSYVDLGSDSVLDLATGTVDMWFRLANPMSAGSNSASGYLLDGGPSYFYFSSSSSKLYYFLSGASVNVRSLSGTWDTNWHNVIVKSDGVTAYMYIDGVQQTTADASGDDLFIFDASVTIGHTSSVSIVGQVAGLRLYNRALTYAEIQQNYNAFKSRFGK